MINDIWQMSNNPIIQVKTWKLLITIDKSNMTSLSSCESYILLVIIEWKYENPIKLINKCTYNKIFSGIFSAVESKNSINHLKNSINNHSNAVSVFNTHLWIFSKYVREIMIDLLRKKEWLLLVSLAGDVNSHYVKSLLMGNKIIFIAHYSYLCL